jgi:hypothetical protein
LATGGSAGRAQQSLDRGAVNVHEKVNAELPGIRSEQLTGDKPTSQD